MIKLKILIILIIITAAPCISAAQNPELPLKNTVLLPVKNESGHSELNKSAEKIRSVIRQTLLMVGRQNVIIEDKPVQGEFFLNYCIENNVDYIIYGDLKKQDREIAVELFIYSVENNSEIISIKETADSPVRLRDSVKKAVSDLLSRFSGEEINFTSLAFTNMTEEKGEYYIYIDNILFGKNIDYLELLLSGTRNIKIIQNRLFTTYNAGEINALLLPDDRVSIEFKIPPLLKKEKKYIDRYTKTIDRYINDKYYSQKVNSSFSSLFSLLKNPEFSDTAVKIKEEYTLKYKVWLQNIEKWETNKGFTSADRHYSLGFKTIFLLSSFDINDWDMGGTKPEGKSEASMGFGFTGSADIFSFFGLQTEVLVCRQKTETLYPSGYPVLNLSEIKTSTWFCEAPLIVYLRAPESLVKMYGGISYKYRITPLRLEGKDAGTGESVSDKYDDEYMKMHLPSWLAGFTMEFPFKNSVFSLDFRYNRDFKSWFDSGTPEEDYIAQYTACSVGYSAKF